MCRIFFGETLCLVKHGSVNDTDQLLACFSALGSPAACQYLFPFVKIRDLMLKAVCGVWSTSGSHQIRFVERPESILIFVRKVVNNLEKRPQMSHFAPSENTSSFLTPKTLRVPLENI